MREINFSLKIISSCIKIYPRPGQGPYEKKVLVSIGPTNSAQIFNTLSRKKY